MKFATSYRCLKKNEYVLESLTLVPIRFEDRDDIRRWRNSQIEFLRQKKPLSESDQEAYFKNVVGPTFSLEQPDQLLFSILENKKLIGYGGLVHIQWRDQNAEISFLLEDTRNEKASYLKLFNTFLQLITLVALDLKLHKIYTFGFDIEHHRFKPLTENYFENEVTLKHHVQINGCLHDVKIFSKRLSHENIYS